MSLTVFHGDTKFVENIIQDLHPRSQAFLQSINSWCIGSLHSHFFSSIWQLQTIWSAVDLWHQNPHWWCSKFPTHMKLTFTAGCWMKFCM